MQASKVKGVRVFMEELFGLLEEFELPKLILVVDIDNKEVAEKGSRSRPVSAPRSSSSTSK